MIRRIRDLLYNQGFTISGARNKLQELVQIETDKRRNGEVISDDADVNDISDSRLSDFSDLTDFENSESEIESVDFPAVSVAQQSLQLVRRELYEIRDLLSLTN